MEMERVAIRDECEDWRKDLCGEGGAHRSLLRPPSAIILFDLRRLPDVCGAAFLRLEDILQDGHLPEARISIKGSRDVFVLGGSGPRSDPNGEGSVRSQNPAGYYGRAKPSTGPIKSRCTREEILETPRF